MRLFVGVYPSAEAVAHLAAHVAGLHIGRPRAPGHSLRAVAPPQWHLTLAFLGDVPDEREPAARAALATAVAAAGPVPRLRFGGGGRFGRGRFTVVWTGVRGDVTALADLAATVRRELRRGRLPFDAKTFRPHLTLARPADRLPAADLAADLAALSAYQGPEWTADAVTLVRSHLGPVVRHDGVATFPLPRTH